MPWAILRAGGLLRGPEAARLHPPEQQRAGGGLQTFSAKPSRFLTYWVHAYDDGTALFTWEFAITDYLLEHGMQLGSGEALNTFLFQ